MDATQNRTAFPPPPKGGGFHAEDTVKQRYSFFAPVGPYHRHVRASSSHVSAADRAMVRPP
jgi:hypothetical protein